MSKFARYLVDKGGDNMKFLEGYKTKIGLIIIFVLGGLKAVGVLDDEAFNLLVPFAVTLTGYGIYDRIGRKK